MSLTFRPHRARSLGLITNYRCTNRCAHCLYCSSPRVEDIIDEERLLEIVAHISSDLPGVFLHIGGGEPLIHFEMIKKLVAAIVKSCISLEYIETNGIPLITHTEEKLKEIKAAGARCMLLSISPFHNEFISVTDMERIYQAIVSILGYDGIFPWHPDYLPFLKREGGEKPVLLDDILSHLTHSEIRYLLTSVMYIHPGGRSAHLLAKYLPLYPPEKLSGHPCHEFLASGEHAHIDYEGNYLTGFCSGLRLGVRSALDLPKLYRDGVELPQFPLLEKLITGGVGELFLYALEREYESIPSGYAHPCHLCLDIRTYLYFRERCHAELYPDFLYEELSSGKLYRRA